MFRPTIMMQTSLSDGRIVTFDISVENFHVLRYHVAKVNDLILNHQVNIYECAAQVLRDMQELERHPSKAVPLLYIILANI